MEIRLYKPPTSEEPYYTPVAVTHAATSINYTEHLYTYGDFEIIIPCEAHRADAFAKYLFADIGGMFWGIILSLEKTMGADGNMLTVSGLDLKGLTSSRYTLPPEVSDSTPEGIAGYDAVKGTTEFCMKHFVRSNFFMEASPTRSVPGLTIAPDLGRGLSDDHYMSRFDLLSDVLAELGQAAEIGYSLKPDIAAGTMIFDCVEGLDRSAEQSNNPRVIFNIERGNVASMSHSDSDRNMRNLFYSTLSGAKFEDEAYTATYTRDGTQELPAGIFRWEQHLDISASHPEAGREYDELKRLTLIRAESYATSEAFTADLLETKSAYGTDYFLGDIVTVQNRSWGISTNPRITAVSLSASPDSVTRSVTFGKAPINPLQRLRRQIRGG